MSELRLEAGKRYVRRDGTVAPELIKDGVFLRDYERDLMFMEDNPFMFNWTQPKPSDLISEYKEESSDDELLNLETFYAKKDAIELALKIASKMPSRGAGEMLSDAGKILQFIEDNMPNQKE